MSFGGGGERSVCHKYMCILQYIKLCGVVVLHRSNVNWRRANGVSLPWVYVHSALYDTYFVWCCYMDLCLIRGGAASNLPWVYVHSALYATMQCSGVA